MFSLRQRTIMSGALAAVLTACTACSCGSTNGTTGSGGGGATGGSGAGAAGRNGGATASGGVSGSGGTASGGSGTSGGAPGSGGKAGTGGTAGGGGDAATGGRANTGGTGAGASTSTGGRGTGSASGGGGGGGGGGGQGASVGASGGAGGTSCTTPPPASTLVGWAAVNGMGQNGTTGGGSATPVTVTTAAAFTSNISGTTARVIYVMGNFSGVFSIGSNKTIVGLCGARLQGHVSLSRAVNVIVRNLTIVGNNCTDSPSDCSGGSDAVTVGDSSHHVWFDHDDIYDGSDGNMDITSGADFVTVSWSKFHYSTKRTDPEAGASGHRFSNLIGSSDDVPGDVGHLNVTFHHNWWADNVDQRMPRTRYGKIHVFNNLFTAAGNNYCTNAGYMATLLVENNVYIGVKNPLQENTDGNMKAVNNVLTGTTGTMTATGSGFTPSYAYTAEPTDSLQTGIMAGAGPH